MSRKAQLEKQAERLGITIHSYRPGRARLYAAEHRDGRSSRSMPIREFESYLDGYERRRRERPDDGLLLASANAAQVLERISVHLPSDWQIAADSAKEVLTVALEPHTQEIEAAYQALHKGGSAI